jgi:hypothetical protein
MGICNVKAKVTSNVLLVVINLLKKTIENFSDYFEGSNLKIHGFPN